MAKEEIDLKLSRLEGCLSCGLAEIYLAFDF